MKEVLERHKLSVGNTLDTCKGTITRQREVEGRTEKSVIDYFFMCE